MRSSRPKNMPLLLQPAAPLTPSTAAQSTAAKTSFATLPTELHSAIAKFSCAENNHDTFIKMAATNGYLFDVAANVALSNIRATLKKAKTTKLDQSQWVNLATIAKTLRHLANDTSVWASTQFQVKRHEPKKSKVTIRAIDFDAIKSHLEKPVKDGRIAQTPSLNTLIALDVVDKHIDNAGLRAVRVELCTWIHLENALHNGIKAIKAARIILSAYKNQATELRLDDYGLKTLPDVLGEITTLQLISVKSNRLFKLPNSLRRLDQLKHLELCDNHFATWPTALARISSLTHLDISSNLLTVLPRKLPGTARLRYLSLADNYLTRLPTGLRRLRYLQNIDLSSNRFGELPRFVRQMQRTQVVVVNNDRLTLLPDA